MNEDIQTQPPPAQPASRRESPSLIGGIVLITLGLLFLADRLVPGFRFSDYWPVLLILIGAGLLWKSRRI
jgi:phage shock protein C